MLLECRNSSNTAQNLLREGHCAINFITDERKYFKEAVRLGFPGETSKEKMEKCIYTLEDGRVCADNTVRPKVIAQEYQVFECTWDDSLENAQRDKPASARFRDSTNLWYTRSRFLRQIAMKIPAAREADLTGVVYAANRTDPDVKFTENACNMMVKIPRVFLKAALQRCVDWAKVNGVSVIDVEQRKQINDKRNREKNGK